ncbi:MAG: hypothetical protein ACFFCW_49560 [Candidatus Hodarchaeota archaeon]
MDLLRKSPITGEERQKCLTFIEEEFKIAVFFQRVKGEWEKAFTEATFCRSSVLESNKPMNQANLRLAQMAEEAVKCRDEMSPIPTTALSANHAWQRVYSAYAAWARESSALGSGISLKPNISKDKDKIIGSLLNEYEKNMEKATKEYDKLFKRLGLSDEET